MNFPRIALLTLTAVSILPAQAAESLDVQERQVSLSGLDLNQPAAAARVYRNIRTAAESVCRGLSTREPGSRYQLWRTCVTDAVARAVKDVDAPLLTAYHADKSRKGNKALSVAAR